jgi:TonB family protein
MVKWLAQFDEETTKIMELRDSLGTPQLLDGTGIWSETYKEVYTNIPMVVRGRFKNYQMDGTWLHEMPDRSAWAEEVFDKGKFIKGFVIADSMRLELRAPFTNPLLEDVKHQLTSTFAYVRGVSATDYPHIKRLRKAEENEKEKTVEQVTIPGGPIGGMAAFYQAVSSLINYPKEARRMGIEGRVAVEFVIERDGSLAHFKVKEGVGSGLDEEAVRVIRESQRKVKWVPYVVSRRRVKVRYTMPIIFRLG